MPLPRAAATALLLTLTVLPGCSNIGLPKEAAPEPEPAYTKLVADYLKSVFKGYASYSDFEIAGVRWVHAPKGWAWLACARFQDHGRQRTYALFIKDGAVFDARYAVQTDACDAQTYSPFDVTTGAIKPVDAGIQKPIY